MPCKVCLSETVRFAFSSHGHELARCEACDHLYVSDRIAASTLDDIYAPDYFGVTAAASAQMISDGCNVYKDYLGTAEKRTAGFKSRLNEISRFFPRPGRLLDYGCAIGLFVKVAQDAGWLAKGYERSRWAAGYGKRTFGVEIEIADGCNNPFTPESFDVITLWDLLEHVENPRDTFDQIGAWLRPGGMVCLNTINASSLAARLVGKEWRHLHPPYHLQYFSRRSLMRLFEEHHFKIVSLKANGTLLAARSDDQPAPKPLRVLEDLVTHWRVRSLATALNLLDEIEVVAVKR